jgi:arylsulfatase A-like enzyme
VSDARSAGCCWLLALLRWPGWLWRRADYVQPLCSPTRGTIMTGRYPSHTGIGPDVLVENVPYGMPGREVFVAQYLKDAGYMTHVGCQRLVGEHSSCTPELVV